MTTYQIQLAFSETQEFVDERSSGYRTIVTASVVSGFSDPGVFVLQKIDSQTSQFCAVATPVQMIDLLVGVPDANGYFRASALDLLVNDPLTATEVKQLLIEDTRFLCHEMIRLGAQLSPTTTITISSDDPLG